MSTVGTGRIVVVRLQTKTKGGDGKQATAREDLSWRFVSILLKKFLIYCDLTENKLGGGTI